MSGLGDVCPPCYINSGGDCEICPDGADDFPECAGCVNGVRASLVSAATSSIFAPRRRRRPHHPARGLAFR